MKGTSTTLLLTTATLADKNQSIMNQSSTFKYDNHTFQGIRLFSADEDFVSITKMLYSVVSHPAKGWVYEDFYAQAYNVTSTPYDIFLMDNKFVVVPAHNGLFIYGFESDRLYKKFQINKEKMAETITLQKNLFPLMVSTLQSYLSLYGSVTIPDGVWIPFTSVYKEGIVCESIKRIFIDSKTHIHVITDEDEYIHRTDELKLEQLLPIFNYLTTL